MAKTKKVVRLWLTRDDRRGTYCLWNEKPKWFGTYWDDSGDDSDPICNFAPDTWNTMGGFTIRARGICRIEIVQGKDSFTVRKVK